MRLLLSSVYCCVSLLSWSSGSLVAAVAAVSSPVPTHEDQQLNLAGRSHFYVCASKIQGMNGRYVLSDDAQSDADTPVYIREDDSDDDSSTGTVASPPTQDVRLFRHNGFWMFADVASWPPTTLFRCDPTKRNIADVDTLATCSVNLPTPPRLGYSPADPTHPVPHLVLYDDAECQQPATIQAASASAAASSRRSNMEGNAQKDDEKKKRRGT
ncbi:hypothetical protein PINS_up010651 [Pythium insidiosum]|nr:hypothetical protein PINS_up010651 [Pythium insidiosum]